MKVLTAGADLDDGFGGVVEFGAIVQCDTVEELRQVAGLVTRPVVVLPLEAPPVDARRLLAEGSELLESVRVGPDERRAIRSWLGRARLVLEASR